MTQPFLQRTTQTIYGCWPYVLGQACDSGSLNTSSEYLLPCPGKGAMRWDASLCHPCLHCTTHSIVQYMWRTATTLHTTSCKQVHLASDVSQEDFHVLCRRWPSCRSLATRLEQCTCSHALTCKCQWIWTWEARMKYAHNLRALIESTLCFRAYRSNCDMLLHAPSAQTTLCSVSDP